MEKLVLEIHTDDILNFSPAPPRKVWVDFIPTWLINPIRKRWGVPAASPRERWHILVFLLKAGFDLLYSRQMQVPAITQALREGPIRPEDIN
jgi:hypothetical protein